VEQITKPDVIGQSNDVEGVSKEDMVQILINCNQDITAIKELLTIANYEERFR
jgi:DNA-binding protein YbaB